MLIAESLATRTVAWLPALWFVVAVVAIVVVWRTGIVKQLLARLKKIDGFGMAFEFSIDSARETRDTVEEGLKAVRVKIQRELEADVRAKSLQYGLKSILEASRLGTADDYRATIHIPDPLYGNSLYQLLDYFPSGSGHGRTFSARSGLIGKVWRLSEPDEWDHATSAITAGDLMAQWGMTDREAADRKVVDKKKIIIATPLYSRSGAQRLGILYLDSDKPDRFGGSKQDRIDLLNELSALYLDRLAEPLRQVVESILLRSPQLTLKGV